VHNIFHCSLRVGGVKLLGVPALPYKSGQKTGPVIAEITSNLLEEWSCKECITGMVFDTTSLNTGSLTAACVSNQTELDGKVTFIACLSTSCWQDYCFSCMEQFEGRNFKKFRVLILFCLFTGITMKKMSYSNFKVYCRSKTIFAMKHCKFGHGTILRER